MPSVLVVLAGGVAGQAALPVVVAGAEAGLVAGRAHGSRIVLARAADPSTSLVLTQSYRERK